MPRPPPVIETPRLRLRPPRLEDAQAVFHGYAADPRVTRFLTWRPHTSVAVTRTFLEQFVAAAQEGPGAGWLIESRETAAVIGAASIDMHRFRASLGYCLAHDLWGQGLMPEAMQPIVAWALHQPAIFRVWATCDVDNTASARVLEKLGMQREGILRRWNLHPNLSPEPRDAWSYAAVK